MRRITLAVVAGLLLAARPAAAQEWVSSIFPERSFDFGTVARGSKVHHAFRLINRTDQEVRIVNWRTKCGCTEVRVGARVIPPGTQTVVEAVIDTAKFEGPKPSGLTLVLDRPTFAEVDLNLHCFIRGDITLNPGQVDFGIVARSARPTVSMNLAYAGGQPSWGITKIQTQSPHVSLTAKVLDGDASGDGRVRYALTATLDPKVGNGLFKDEVTLYTNDPASPTIPISVTANVQSAVTVSPKIINLGRVKPGDIVKKTVLVRSQQPFKLTTLKSSKDDLAASPDPEGTRPLHTVQLTFKAPSKPGPYHAVFEIATDLKDEPPAKLTTFATVVP